jgi:hypothetical protein
MGQTLLSGRGDGGANGGKTVGLTLSLFAAALFCHPSSHCRVLSQSLSFAFCPRSLPPLTMHCDASTPTTLETAARASQAPGRPRAPSRPRSLSSTKAKKGNEPLVLLLLLAASCSLRGRKGATRRPRRLRRPLAPLLFPRQRDSRNPPKRKRRKKRKRRRRRALPTAPPETLHSTTASPPLPRTPAPRAAACPRSRPLRHASAPCCSWPGRPSELRTWPKPRSRSR